jgi:ubiquinol-cytochrome c reductase cytochrome c subunit
MHSGGQGGGHRGGAAARHAAVRGMYAAVVVLAAFGASAQHETALDIEDGRRVYEATCANCHGPDGNLIAGIDFGRGVFRRPYRNDELAALIVAGIPNTPMLPNAAMSMDQALRVAEYLRSMSAGRVTAAEGDPARGRALFEGKGECRDCHAVAGAGSRVGPDLSRIGQLRRAGELERSPRSSPRTAFIR